jgi:hypothetical protein
MSDQPVFPRRVLIGWISAAVALFAVTLYFMASGDSSGGGDRIGPSTFSHSAIGYAGIAEVLQRQGFSVVKSQYDSLAKASPGSVVVIAEPRTDAASESTIRSLLASNATMLLVLPKWTGGPSEDHPGWLGSLAEGQIGDAKWTLRLIAPKAEVTREPNKVFWTINALRIAPSIDQPIQLMRGQPPLHPIVAAPEGMLIGEVVRGNRRIWVLSDPDIIANQGFGRDNNAALVVAAIKRLRRANGSVIFDETVHGFVARPASPFLLLFRFPFVVATIQGLIAVALLLWATLGRFGAPQSLPPPLSAGRSGLLQNMASLIEFTGHQETIIRRYILETVRDVGRQLHAPRGISGNALVAWLQRVGSARAVETDCGAVIRQIDELPEGRRRNISTLVRLARQIHQWKGEIIDGRVSHPRGH